MIKSIDKHKVTLITILLIIVSFLFIYFEKKEQKTEISYSLTEENPQFVTQENGSIVQEKAEVKEQTKQIPLFICGEVNSPGVYYVPEDTLVNDAVALAGGFTENASVNSINLAREVVSNEKIYIPSQEESLKGVDAQQRFIESEEPLVNINEADFIALQTLPGIGEVKAKQIITYRNQKGIFIVKEDFKKVPGIGEKIYESLEALITTE